jgi:hypothetical protein
MSNAESSKELAFGGSKLGRLLNIGRSPTAVRLRSELCPWYCHFKEHHWLCVNNLSCPLCEVGSPRRRNWFALFDADTGAQGLVRISNTLWSQHFAGAQPGMAYLAARGERGLSLQRHPRYDRSVAVIAAAAVTREVLTIHGITFAATVEPDSAAIARAVVVKAREAIL